MSSPFAFLTLQQVTSHLEDRVRQALNAQEAVDFYNGDHWRGSLAWLGQRPDLKHPDYQLIMTDIQAGQVSENTIKEVVDRHMGGILGREPAWDYVLRRPLAKDEEPEPEEAKVLQLGDSAVTGWWDARKPLQALKDATRHTLLARYAYLRMYVPSGLRDEQGQVGRSTFDAALETLRCEFVAGDRATMMVDPAAEAVCGLYTYTRQDVRYVEMSYLDDNGFTILRVLGSDDTEIVSTPLDLGGRLLLFEMKRDPLITPQVCQNQKGLNLAKTKMIRNVNVAGDLERTVLNAEPPTVEIDDPVNPGQKKRVAAPHRTGASVTMYVQGSAIFDNQGNVINRLNPSISYRDPVKIDTFTGTRDDCYKAILGQCHQTHALIAGDATASGVSRQQARTEYEASLGDTKVVADDALRWLLETAAAYAAQIAGQTGLFAGVRVEANAIIDSGPVSTEERDANRKDVQASLLSPETAMSRNGVDDVDGERQRIREAADEQQAAAVASFDAAFNRGV